MSQTEKVLKFDDREIILIGTAHIISSFTCGCFPAKLKNEYRKTLKYINSYQDLLNLYKKIKEIEIFQRLLLKNQKIHHQNKEEDINDSNKILLTNCSNGISFFLFV